MVAAQEGEKAIGSRGARERESGHSIKIANQSVSVPGKPNRCEPSGDITGNGPLRAPTAVAITVDLTSGHFPCHLGHRVSIEHHSVAQSG